MIIANVIVIVIHILNVFIDIACALRALGLLLADSALTKGKGGRLSGTSTVFFYVFYLHNLGTKSKKSLPAWDKNRLSEGYKQAFDQNWGRLAITRFVGKKTRFWAQKKPTS